MITRWVTRWNSPRVFKSLTGKCMRTDRCVDRNTEGGWRILCLDGGSYRRYKRSGPKRDYCAHLSVSLVQGNTEHLQVHSYKDHRCYGLRGRGRDCHFSEPDRGTRSFPLDLCPIMI